MFPSCIAARVPVRGRGLLASSSRSCAARRLRGRGSFTTSSGLEGHEKQTPHGFRFGQLHHRQPHGGIAAVGFHAHAFVDDLAFLRRRPAQRRRQFDAQAFARHFQDVQARLARGGLEVIARPAVDVEDVAAVIDDDAGRGVAQQQSFFDHRGELLLPRAGHHVGYALPGLASARAAMARAESGRQGVLTCAGVFARKDFPFLNHNRVVAARSR